MPDIRGIVTEWLSAIKDAIDAISVTINPGDLQIGAVELKDYNSEIRKKITISENIVVADDVIKTYVTLEGGTNNERISTISYHSATVHNEYTVVDTFAWSGTPPNHYLASITRVLS